MSSSNSGVSSPGGVVLLPGQSTSELPRRWAEEELGQAAYQRCLPQMLALPPSQIKVVNLNLTELVATGLGVLPNVRTHRAALEKSVLDCRFHWVDALEDYMLALNYARAEYLTVTRPNRCSPELWLEARQVRRALMHDWYALGARGLLTESLLRGLKRGKGYLEMGSDLTVLSHVHRVYAASAGVAVPAEAERAEVLARWILTAGGRPDPKSKVVLQTRDMQNRMFTVAVRGYGEIRHAVTYMRRDQGDVDELFPSFYAARRTGASTARRAVSTKPKDTTGRSAAAAPVSAEAPQAIQPSGEATQASAEAMQARAEAPPNGDMAAPTVNEAAVSDGRESASDRSVRPVQPFEDGARPRSRRAGSRGS
jgi:hypothetical protein